MDAKTLEKTLRKLCACAEAREWSKGKTLAQAWAECPRGDWMLWLAGRTGVDRKLLVLAACACARLALPHVRAGEARPLQAIEIAERWARGDASATLDDVRKAASAAAFAAADAAADAAAAAAAAAAAFAADAAAAAAFAAAFAAARSKALLQCAALVRERIPLDVLTAALSAKEES